MLEKTNGASADRPDLWALRAVAEACGAEAADPPLPTLIEAFERRDDARCAP